MQPLLLAVALWLAAGVASAGAGVQDTTKDPDRLYADRERLDSALDAAVDLGRTPQERPQGFRSRVETGARLLLAGRTRRRQTRGARSSSAASRPRRQATVIHADRPEGYFWMAANMGAMAESFGLRAGIKYRGPVKKALETVIMIDRGFQQGSADRALGRWYLKVPRLFGGSKDKSVEHLKQSLTYDPTSLASLYFLAETYLEMDRKNEARQEAQKVIDGPIHAEWAPEDREFKQKAKALLERLRESWGASAVI